MSRPTVLLLGMDDAEQADLRLALKDVANVVRSKTPAELIADEYRSINPGAAIVSVKSDTPQRFGLIHNIAAAGGIVIVVSESKDPELILRSMRAGAREFVLESDHEELRLAVRTHAKVTFGTGELGQVITVFGAKGGVGATAIATNLAGAMQRRSLRVCLVDLDLYLGDVLAFLDIPGSYSITDVLANMSRLDRELLATSVTKHRSGVSVLAQSSKVEEAEQIKGPDVTALLEFLRRNYDFVIVDGVRGFDELSLAALDGSQHVFMTLTQDVRRCATASSNTYSSLRRAAAANVLLFTSTADDEAATGFTRAPRLGRIGRGTYSQRNRLVILANSREPTMAMVTSATCISAPTGRDTCRVASPSSPAAGTMMNKCRRYTCRLCAPTDEMNASGRMRAR